MKAYTNVVLDRWEREIIQRADLSLGIVYPEIHEAFDKGDHRTRRSRALARIWKDRNQGTYAHLLEATEVLSELVAQLTIESRHAYWIEQHERATSKEIPESEDPTSGWMVLKMLSEIRIDQLRQAMQAFDILTAALALAKPVPTDEETGDD